MRRVFTCLICLGAVFSASGRGAADSNAPDFDQTGVYLAAGAAFGISTQLEGWLKDEFKEGGLPGLDVDHEEVFGYKARLGFRYHPVGAVELEFERGLESDVSVKGIGALELDTWAAMVNFKLYPLGGRIQPFALFGVGALHLEVKEKLGLDIRDTFNELAIRAGVGVDVYATENVFLFLDASYVVPTDDLRYVDYASFGVGAGYRW